MKKLLIIIVAFAIVLSTASVTYAVPIQLGTECCQRAYRVYGDEQPVPGTDADGIGTCEVSVNLDPIITDEDREEAQDVNYLVGPIITDEDGEEAQDVNYLSSIATGGESLVSSITALFAGLGLKEDLMKLVKVVFKGHTEKYHAFLDEEIFGPAIAKVSEFESSKDLSDFLQDKEGQCDADNPLPRCVVERALCSYEKYSGVLFEQSGQQLVDSTSTSQDISTMLAVLQNRDQALLQEAIHSEQALDTAMAVYSQFVDTYRLHLKFKELIAALVKVRNVTSFLHQLVECIPNKFVGVATTKCN